MWLKSVQKIDFNIKSTFHSVEISWFLYHSDFMWNQFWEFCKFKISHFSHFTTFYDFINFCTFLTQKMTIFANCRAYKMAKTAVLVLLESPKLISHKIWMIQTTKIMKFPHCVRRCPFFFSIWLQVFCSTMPQCENLRILREINFGGF